MSSAVEQYVSVIDQLEERKSVEKGNSMDEKHQLETNASVDVSSVEEANALRGDEALRLVGQHRSTEFSEEYYKKLKRRLDWVIPPLCSAVYFTQYLDKNTVNYASIMGLPITGQNYNLVAMAFFLGYLTWEFPTVYISQKLRVAKYLGVNIVLWGAVLMLHASTTSFGAFFFLRFLLGMLESCVAPILILIISMFYKKEEQGLRIAWFYVMNGLALVFGGFVAYGISYYSGTKFLPYRILYLLIGGLAIIVGICVIIWMPDSPVHTRMLSKEERIAALERVRDDQVGIESKTLKKEQIVEALMDVRTWLLVLLTMVLASVPNGALSVFGNIIVKSFGYTTKQTLILNSPGGFVSAAMTLFLGWYSDKKKERMLPIIIALIPTIIGTALLIGMANSGNKGVLLFASYLMATIGPSLSLIYTYNASNTSGHTKKSTINALTLFTYGLGNVIGTEIMQSKDAPQYIPGKTAVMVMYAVGFFIPFLMRWMNVRLNKQKQAKLREMRVQNGWTDADMQRERDRHAFMDLTDKQNPFFEYIA